VCVCLEQEENIELKIKGRSQKLNLVFILLPHLTAQGFGVMNK
jgi:hypothetical protein